MNYLEKINQTLELYLSSAGDTEKVLFDAIKYALQGGGKRVRPSLLLECCRICGGDIADALPFACAIECIHSYSLVHDDLPCMDDDDFRRGQPTAHKVFGEANALLAGDALLTLAFEAASDTKTSLNSDAKLSAINELALAAGAAGMVGGQIIDLSSEGKKIDYNTLKRLHSKKTGALIKASAKIGAITACAPPDKLKACEDYGSKIGIVFQIIDDILDVTGSFEELGKPIGSDEQNEKSTYVTLFGVDKARTLAEKTTDEAIECLEIFGKDADSLRDFAKSLLLRKN